MVLGNFCGDGAVQFWEIFNCWWIRHLKWNQNMKINLYCWKTHALINFIRICLIENVPWFFQRYNKIKSWMFCQWKIKLIFQVFPKVLQLQKHSLKFKSEHEFIEIWYSHNSRASNIFSARYLDFQKGGRNCIWNIYLDFALFVMSR